MKKLVILFLAVPVILFCMAMQNNLKLLDLGAFQITVPENWKYIKEQGDDSFIGRIASPNLLLSFDFSSNGYANSLLSTEEEYIIDEEWNQGYFYKPGVTYTANFNVKNEKIAQMKKLGTTDSTLVKVEADPSYETKRNILRPTPAEKTKYPKADYIAHLTYRNQKIDVPIEIPVEIKAHYITIDSTGKYMIKTIWPKVPGKGMTGVYMKSRKSSLNFQISGEGLPKAQEGLALQAFKTIKIKE